MDSLLIRFKITKRDSERCEAEIRLAPLPPPAVCERAPEKKTEFLWLTCPKARPNIYRGQFLAAAADAMLKIQQFQTSIDLIYPTLKFDFLTFTVLLSKEGSTSSVTESVRRKTGAIASWLKATH